MITLKSEREISQMDEAGDFLASIHIGLRDIIKPGMTCGILKNMSASVVRKKIIYLCRLV